MRPPSCSWRKTAGSPWIFGYTPPRSPATAGMTRPGLEARGRERRGGPGPRLTVTVTPERTESLPIRTRAARQGTQGYRPRGMLQNRPGEVGHPHHVPVPEVGGPKGPVSGPGIGTSPSPMHVPGDRNSPGPFSCRMEEICPSLFTSAAGTPTSRAPGPARGSSSPSRRA